MTETQRSLACDLTAMPENVRQEHILTAPKLFLTTQEVQELPTGYAFRFLDEPGKFTAIVTYIENERLCCPFFNFELEVRPHGGALWLRLTGSEGVKELLRSGLFEGEIGGLKKLIQTNGDVQLAEIVERASFPGLTGLLNKASDK